MLFENEVGLLFDKTTQLKVERGSQIELCDPFPSLLGHPINIPLPLIFEPQMYRSLQPAEEGEGQKEVFML